MAYIGSIPAYQASGVRPRDEFTCDGTQICFALSQTVPGSFESSVTVVLDNVPQQPVEAFTVVDTRTLTFSAVTGTFTVNETVTGGTSTATGTVLKVNLGSIVVRQLTGTFANAETVTGGSSAATATTSAVDTNSGGGILFSEAPAASAVLYVVHEGNATYDLIPSAASVGPNQLTDNLKNFTVDTFTGDNSTVAFTLSATPASANSILVMVDGVVQTRTTNYTLSSNTLTFTGTPDTGAAITVIHLGFSTTSRTGLVDGSVTPAKLSSGGLYWNTSSNVGIGTTSPSQRLTLGSGTILIKNASGDSNGLQIYQDTSDVSRIYNYYSGSLVLGTNNTERMRIDSTGRVGIGTNSPSSILHLSSTLPILSFTDTDDSATSRVYQDNESFVIDVDNANAKASSVFKVNIDSTERMRIDSAGRLTKPYQPAFCVSGTTFSGTDFLGTTITTNVGSHFNVSNGRFTAPISGMYLLSFALTTEDSNSHFIEIAVNGSNVANRQLTYGVAFQSATQFVIVNINAGDYAIARRRDTGYAVYNAVFSGYLLG